MNLNERIADESVIIERDTSKLPKGVTARVRRTICWLDRKNANKRKYSKGVWEHVFNDSEYQRKLSNRQILGEMEHPENSALKLDKDRTSHIVHSIYYGQPELIEGKMYTPVKTEFDLLPTEAGKFILILLEAGVKVGASTRADGELEEAIDEDGSKFMNVIENSYSFTTIDHTGDASCQNTEPDLIISAAMSGYENKSLNKNVAMALLEKAGTDKAKVLEEIIRADKQHKNCKCKSLKDKQCSGNCANKDLKEVVTESPGDTQDTTSAISKREEVLFKQDPENPHEGNLLTPKLPESVKVGSIVKVKEENGVVAHIFPRTQKAIVQFANNKSTVSLSECILINEQKKCSGNCAHANEKEVESDGGSSIKEDFKDDTNSIAHGRVCSECGKRVTQGEDKSSCCNAEIVKESVNENMYTDIENAVTRAVIDGKTDEDITNEIRSQYKNANLVVFDLLPKVIQRIRNEVKESKIKEELTTSSDNSGQPANLAAAKEDEENSKNRGEEIDRRLDSIADQQLESKVNEDLSKLSDNDLVSRYKELAKDTNHQEINKEVEAMMTEINKRNLSDKVKESKVNEVLLDTNIVPRIKAFLDDNWKLFLTDADLLPDGDPNSKRLDAIKNVIKVFKTPPEKAEQYVDELGRETHKLSAVPAMSNENVVHSDSHNLGESTRLAVVIAEKNVLAEELKSVKEHYSDDVIRYATEIDALKEEKRIVVEHYSNDSIHFATETSALTEKITRLEKDYRTDNNTWVKEHLERGNTIATLNEQIKKLTEEKTKLSAELSEKIGKLTKDLKESEFKIKLLKESKEQEIKDLKETHSKEKINLYVDNRLKSMGLKLHENVLTLLRQSKNTAEVDTLIRETQDALREGLTQSVNKISEVIVTHPVDKVQADINDKVSIALKHLTGL
jgi:hypothetical protein